jgi:hypothetical protein
MKKHTAQLNVKNMLIEEEQMIEIKAVGSGILKG